MQGTGNPSSGSSYRAFRLGQKAGCILPPSRWGQEGTVQREGDSQLMVMPSSTPRLLGSFTWKVPLLGMTDSGDKQMWTHVRLAPHLFPFSWEGPAPSCFSHPRDVKTEARELTDWFKTTNPRGQSGTRDWNPDLTTASWGFPTAKPNPTGIQ